MVASRPRPVAGQTSRPGWQLELVDTPADGTLNAARLAVADGCLGSMAVSETADPGSNHAQRAVFVNGLYGPEPPGQLVAADPWTPTGRPGRGLSWSLDLETGMVSHRIDGPGPAAAMETRRWAIAGSPGCQVFVTPVTSDHEREGTQPDPPPPGPELLTTVLRGADGRVAVLVVAERRHGDEVVRVASAVTGSAADATGPLVRRARHRVDALACRPPSELARQQRQAWATRWSAAAVAIDGDPVADQRSRFTLFQLLRLADHAGELAVGPRGLSGQAYNGHVMWDADVFVLPALASLVPSAARAMVEYRLRRLGLARAYATASGLPGARFPWESAATGADVTPLSGRTPAGDEVAIHTGPLELHVSADICWAIDRYRRWVGDDEVLTSGGAELVADVARFWAARIDADPGGPTHLSGVVGPDEYHEPVDDNAFTNQMVAWCLRYADQVTDGPWGRVATHQERRRWRTRAAGLVTGYRPDLGRHEQFAGYDRLTPVLMASITRPPVAADLLLGREGVARTQLIKQADVVMLHHLIPECLPLGSLARDLDHYLPRTAHGSSLSPAVHAAVLARAGRPDEALTWLHLALAIDLDDLTGTGAGGLHFANLGGIWQALLGGFGGVNPSPTGLMVRPCLPSAWRRLELRFRYRGAELRLAADHDGARLQADRPIRLERPDGTVVGTARVFLLPPAERPRPGP